MEIKHYLIFVNIKNQFRNFSVKKRNKIRIPAILASIQYYTESSSQVNKTDEKN